MNVARVLVHQQRFERTQNGGEAGGEETLAQAENSFIRFNTNEGPIEVALDHRRL